MGTPPPASGAAGSERCRARRKISLPWFRQTAHAALARQHTIDTPASLRRANRHKGGADTWWVVAEHRAGGPGEVSVGKGAQVELLEPWSRPDWWLVRVLGEPPLEGAVPAHVLKPPPPSRRAHSQPANNSAPAATPPDAEPAPADAAASAASPGKQRRGFSGRWLGLRKPQPKADKAPSTPHSPAAVDKPAPLKKIPSDKKIKVAQVAGAVGEEPPLDEAEDDVADLELPPPMKPIQDPQAVLQQAPPSPAATQQAPRSSLSLERLAAEGAPNDLAEIEQIVKDRMEAGGGGGSAEGEGAEGALRKRAFVLRELVETEEVYVEDLALVVDGYMRHVQDPNADPPMPDALRDCHTHMIFGKIDAIYSWHKNTFLRELRGCVAAPEQLGPLFRRFLSKRMYMYEFYCRNKPLSEYIVSEHDHYFQEVRQKLGHKLHLGDLLIKPVQRIQKYHLLVQKAVKYSELGGAPASAVASLRDALHCTAVMPKMANDMMDVGRLQGFTGSITSQGKLLLQETLQCAEGSDRPRDTHVFLFEQCIIFADVLGKKTLYTSPTYNYRAHIQVNKMELEEGEGGALVVRAVGGRAWSLRAGAASCALWRSTLASILHSQQAFGDALENPAAYLRELSRDNERKADSTGATGTRPVAAAPPGAPAAAPSAAPPHNGLAKRAWPLDSPPALAEGVAALALEEAWPGAVALRPLPGGGLGAHWEEPQPVHLECRREDEAEWRRLTEQPSRAGCLPLEELAPAVYSFRLVCGRSGVRGPASAPTRLDASWPREQLARRYALEEEVGRGRTARVFAARDTVTGHRVAVKQLLRGGAEAAAREFRVGARVAHGGVARALALFADAPAPGAHSLVLELVRGPPLLEWAAADESRHTQRNVAMHMRRLLDALAWLHAHNVAHLDVRPENVLVELGGASPQLKLVDLGSALETDGGGASPSAGGEVLPPAPAQLEFAPPECVMGRPPTPAWDTWAAGVLLYVFLTGLSPFLDESAEETTTNIIKGDYCFPAEHWGAIDARAVRLVSALLAPCAAERATAAQALQHPWLLHEEAAQHEAPLATQQLRAFLERRRPPQPPPAPDTL